jgi:hypothetical protein
LKEFVREVEMAELPWLGSNFFQLTIKRTVGPGGKAIDLFMLVEPDDGIEPSVAEKIAKEPFNFKTTGKGYWVTSRFIEQKPDGKVSLSLSKLGKAFVAAGIHVRAGKTTSQELKTVYDACIARKNVFLNSGKLIAFAKDKAVLVAVNLNGEDVYEVESGERGIAQGAGFILASDAKTPEEKKRFLINGQMIDGSLTVDSEFVAELVSAELKHLRPGARWSVEDTLTLLSKVVQADASQAANAINVINDVHSIINKAFKTKFESDIAPDSVKANGEMRALKIATNSFSKLLPMYNRDGDEIFMYESPTAIRARQRLAETGLPVVEFADGDEVTILTAFNNLKDSESIFALNRSATYAVSPLQRDLIEQCRKDGDLIGAFNLKDSLNNGPTSMLRVYKFTKGRELAANPDKLDVPSTLLSSSQFSESLNLLDFIAKSDKPLPLVRNELEEALKISVNQSLKEMDYVPLATIGSDPAKYIVPASLATPQRLAMQSFIDRFGEPGEYLATKLQLDVAKIGTLFSKLQVEHIALAISRYEDGFGMIIGDGTGSGKTRQMAAIMRYQALAQEQIIFTTPDKSLLNNLWAEIKLVEADSLITPLVATTEEICNEDGTPVVFASGETSEDHHRLLKEIVANKKVIPGKYNAVFTTYNGVSAAPTIKDVNDVHNFNEMFDEQVRVRRVKAKTKANSTDNDDDKKEEKKIYVRVYDKVGAIKKFAARAETVFIADESHAATGSSNTRKAIDQIKSECSGKIFASATSMKNSARAEIYVDAMRVPYSAASLSEALKVGGEAVAEAFTATLAQEGGLVCAEMSKSAINVKLHVDEANYAQYESISDTYAELMSKYLRMIAYMNKATALWNDKTKFKENPEKFKPSPGAEVAIGLNTTGFSSRFVKTNELFVACLKANYVASEAINEIKQGGKAFIPCELTSETNIKYIRELFDMPQFTEKQIKEGLVDEWVVRQKAADPEFKGFPDNFKHVLSRMFNESMIVKVLDFDAKNKTVVSVQKPVVDVIAASLNPKEIKEFTEIAEAFESELENFPELTASPYDTIINKIRKAGFKADAYSGRHVEIRETEQGIKYLASADTRSCKRVREAFQADELDCAVVGRSGFTGFGWHALHKKHVAMIYMVPPSSSDLEKQLEGRVNRTGQSLSPTIIHPSTGLLVERRIQQMAIQRMRRLNASSKGDANLDAMAADVQLFSDVGIEAVKRYLTNHPDVMAKVGFSEKDIDYNYQSGASVASALTSRLQMVKTSEASAIMAEIESEYYSLLNELEEQGINPFGMPTLDVEAKMSKAIKVGGVENSDNPWNQPVHIANVEYSEKLTVMSSEAVLQEIKENVAGLFEAHGGEAFTINTLTADQRFDRFSKLMAQEADQTLKVIRSQTTAPIEDIEKGHGRLFTQREKFERATEMSKLLAGMKLGQVVRLNTDTLGVGGESEGVVTDIKMLRNGGYSPTMTIAIPGKGTISATAVTVEKLNIHKTPIMFNAKSTLAAEFDNQTETIQRKRVALIGPAFPVLTTTSQILTSHNHRGHNLCKIINLTLHSPERGKYIEKVALLPADISLLNVLSAPMKLDGPQATNYIRFAGDYVRTLITAPSQSTANASDLTMKIVGSEKTGNRTIIISGVKKNHTKLIDDIAMEQFGEPNANGDTGFAAGSAKAKYAEIKVSAANIGPVLKHLHEKHHIQFYAKEYGLKFIEDFNNAMLPGTYQDWLLNCQRDLIKTLAAEKDSEIDLNDILDMEQSNAPAVAAPATP